MGGLSAERCASQLEKGCGWVPANIALTPFDIIADDNPYGSAGDLRLMPDVRAHTDICNVAGLPKLSFYQGDLQELDGSPWEGCVRSMLKNASSDLERKYGLRVIAAFEHEFSLTGEALDSGPSFSITSLRASGGFLPCCGQLSKNPDSNPNASCLNMVRANMNS